MEVQRCETCKSPSALLVQHQGFVAGSMSDTWIKWVNAESLVCATWMLGTLCCISVWVNQGRACLFQGDPQDAPIQVGDIDFGLWQCIRQFDAHMLSEVIPVSLELIVWDLPHNEYQILHHAPFASLLPATADLDAR